MDACGVNLLYVILEQVDFENFCLMYLMKNVLNVLTEKRNIILIMETNQ